MRSSVDTLRFSLVVEAFQSGLSSASFSLASFTRDWNEAFETADAFESKGV